MEGLYPNFSKKLSKGDIIVAGENFGCGSSREQAAICLKYAEVGAIIAKTFARIFYRNAINQGLFVIESSEAVDKIENRDELEIDFDNSIIRIKKKNLQFKIKLFPEFTQEILAAGGLVPHLQKKLLKN